MMQCWEDEKCGLRLGLIAGFINFPKSVNKWSSCTGMFVSSDKIHKFLGCRAYVCNLSFNLLLPWTKQVSKCQMGGGINTHKLLEEDNWLEYCIDLLWKVKTLTSRSCYEKTKSESLQVEHLYQQWKRKHLRDVFIKFTDGRDPESARKQSDRVMIQTDIYRLQE